MNMGYHTEFTGRFKFDRPLEERHFAYLAAFNETRRVRRDLSKLPPDRLRDSVNLPAGAEGEYHVVDEEGASVVDYNESPTTQPGLYCQWRPTRDGTAIKWDGTEKFYDYVEWIKYLIEHFLAPRGYKLNGTVKWSGDEQGDVGTITIADNVVGVKARGQ